MGVKNSTRRSLIVGGGRFIDEGADLAHEACLQLVKPGGDSAAGPFAPALWRKGGRRFVVKQPQRPIACRDRRQKSGIRPGLRECPESRSDRNRGGGRSRYPLGSPPHARLYLVP